MVWKYFASFCYWFIWTSVWWTTDCIPADTGYMATLGLLAVYSFFLAAIVTFWNAAIMSGVWFPDYNTHWLGIDRMSYMFLGFAVLGYALNIGFNPTRIDLMTLFCLFIGFQVHKCVLWYIFSGDETGVVQEFYLWLFGKKKK